MDVVDANAIEGFKWRLDGFMIGRGGVGRRGGGRGGGKGEGSC